MPRKKHLPACKWIDRDDTGRPRCEHGWAISAGPRWNCPEKARDNLRRYRATSKGRETQRRYNASDAGRSSKDLYELTRVRAA